MVKLNFGLTALSVSLSALSVQARYVFYYDQWNTDLPNRTVTAGIDHVIMSFASSSLFTTSPAGNYVPFEKVSKVRSHFDHGTKIMIAIGGWGDTTGFSQAAATNESRKIFAANVAALCDEHGFDGVDIDWEYPGGNGHDYRLLPNSEKTSEVDTFPVLLAEIRRAIGPRKLLSIAAPGKVEDMLAYTPSKSPAIWLLVDWVNVMTYDLINRRHNTTTHHTSLRESLKTIDYYINKLYLDPKKINLGFAMYAKYFRVSSDKHCETGLGCLTEPLENSDGTDTGKSGAITFRKENYMIASTNMTETVDGTCGIGTFQKCPEGQCCSAYGFCGNTSDYCNNCQGSDFGSGCQTVSITSLFQTAMKNSITDEDAGGEYYFDRENSLFWTWDTPNLISRKFKEIVLARGLGGVMAWSLGQDSYDYSHILALKKGSKKLSEITRADRSLYISSRVKLTSNFGKDVDEMSKPPTTSWWKKLWPF
ncbi:Acidic mammalian chitinase [Golovinomyces cichoracearum]|uniref:chitinase n=1 Tax=Golovinomyces cichoracearum TaxID=62708 RepID=A0A420IRD5_9PEZI|nr:Acidic mammalian chitinase [Golovinomyces cichoracearum]